MLEQCQKKVLGESYDLGTRVGRLVEALGEMVEALTVSMLAAYMEFAAHLMSNSSMPKVAVAGSDSCSRVEQKEGGAVPAFCKREKDQSQSRARTVW